MLRPNVQSFEQPHSTVRFGSDRAIERINRYRRAGTVVALVGNGKGGSGKSTTVMNLAVGYGRELKSVLLLDADIEQGTLKKWPRPPQCRYPVIVSCSPADIVKELAARIADFDVVLVDLPGRDVRSVSSAMDVADILICPAKPSHSDLAELGRLIGPANARGLPHLVVFNESTRERTRELDQLRDEFSRFGPFLPVAIQQLADYRRLYAFGRAALEIVGDRPVKSNFRNVFQGVNRAVTAAHGRRVEGL